MKSIYKRLIVLKSVCGSIACQNFAHKDLSFLLDY